MENWERIFSWSQTQGSWGQPWTTGPPAPTSQVLGLQICIRTAILIFLIKKKIIYRKFPVFFPYLQGRSSEYCHTLVWKTIGLAIVGKPRKGRFWLSTQSHVSRYKAFVWQDGSAGKGPCNQGCWPKFDQQTPYDGRRELIYISWDTM